MKTAFISGVCGQDGSYLAELLLENGYEVHGLIRRASSFNTDRIDHIFDKLKLHYGDVTDGQRISTLLKQIQPDHIYHLAAMSHVKVSFDTPCDVCDITATGAFRFLEAMRRVCPDARFYNAASSEMFGVSKPKQSEKTAFRPVSPYAVAKLASYHATQLYRDAYGLFTVNGILFNHESPRRGPTFVTRKITRAAARIKKGKQEKLLLGNLSAVRDWGHSKDYVRAMLLMMEADKPQDYVIGTGEGHSVRQFLNRVFSLAGLHVKRHVEKDARYLRPLEVPALIANPTKAKKELGWKPEISFDALCEEMYENDMECLCKSGC